MWGIQRPRELRRLRTPEGRVGAEPGTPRGDLAIVGARRPFPEDGGVAQGLPGEGAADPGVEDGEIDSQRFGDLLGCVVEAQEVERLGGVGEHEEVEVAGLDGIATSARAEDHGKRDVRTLAQAAQGGHALGREARDDDLHGTCSSSGLRA